MAQDEDPSAPARVVKLTLSAIWAQRKIRMRAADTANLIWTNHVQEQMAKRGIDTDDVLTVLRHGWVDETPIPDPDHPPEVKAAIGLKLSSGREAVVVVALEEHSQALTLVTTYWKDDA